MAALKTFSANAVVNALTLFPMRRNSHQRLRLRMQQVKILELVKGGGTNREKQEDWDLM